MVHSMTTRAASASNFRRVLVPRGDVLDKKGTQHQREGGMTTTTTVGRSVAEGGS
jgi:hypothetical protein